MDIKTEKTTLPKSSEEKSHFHGFDYLRVLFMMMVLLGHSNFFFEAALQREKAVGSGPNFWDFIYYELQSAAVPSFVLMSMLLFAIRKPTWAKTVDRVKKLGYLYAFWVGAWVLCTKIRPEMSLLGLVEFFLRGGGWLFYTFATLILLTPVCWLATKLNKKQLVGAFIASVIIVLGTYYWIYKDFKWIAGDYYWLPSCFMMMPVVAVILIPYIPLLKENSKIRNIVVTLSLLIGVGLAIIEWQYHAPVELVNSERNWLTKFARLSVHFVALSLLIGSLSFKNKAPFIIRFFARNSLGVYCLHPFMLGGLVGIVQSFTKYLSVPLSLFLGCLFSAVVCSILTEFLRKTFENRLV